MPLDLHAYTSIDSLKNIIFSDDTTQFRNDNKQHFSYLDRDLSVLGIRSVLVEKDDVDTDYQEDYSLHYSKCIQNRYSSRCRRLHLFTNEPRYVTEHLTEMICNTERQATSRSPWQTADELGYAGFIVIKPLAQTFIG